MPDDKQIEWRYSKGTDVLEIWSQTDDGGTRRIRVPGTMVRQLTGGVAFEDLPAHSRRYYLKEFDLKPKAYGASVVSP